MQYTFQPQGVCPRMISFELEGNVVRNVHFLGGCNGNLKAVSKLVDGKTVEEIESQADLLRGSALRRPQAGSGQQQVAPQGRSRVGLDKELR